MLNPSLLSLSLLYCLINAQDPSALTQSSTPQGTCQNSNDATCKATTYLHRGADAKNENVVDNYGECAEWAKQGECIVNPR